jgi:hypothetical protein
MIQCLSVGIYSCQVTNLLDRRQETSLFRKKFRMVDLLNKWHNKECVKNIYIGFWTTFTLTKTVIISEGTIVCITVLLSNLTSYCLFFLPLLSGWLLQTNSSLFTNHNQYSITNVYVICQCERSCQRQPCQSANFIMGWHWHKFSFPVWQLSIYYFCMTQSVEPGQPVCDHVAVAIDMNYKTRPVVYDQHKSPVK